MDIRPIRSDSDLDVALARIHALWGSSAGTPAGDELEVLAVLVSEYERVHYSLSSWNKVSECKPKTDEFVLVWFRHSPGSFHVARLGEHVWWSSTFARLSEPDLWRSLDPLAPSDEDGK